MTNLYPYTDETPEERQPRPKPLVKRAVYGHYIYPGKFDGDPHDVFKDVTVYVPDASHARENLVATLSDQRRAFVFQSAQEMQDLIQALQLALDMVRGQGNE